MGWCRKARDAYGAHPPGRYRCHVILRGDAIEIAIMHNPIRIFWIEKTLKLLYKAIHYKWQIMTISTESLKSVKLQVTWPITANHGDGNSMTEWWMYLHRGLNRILTQGWGLWGLWGSAIFDKSASVRVYTTTVPQPISLPPPYGQWYPGLHQNEWPIEMKDVEKWIIIKDVDRCSMQTVPMDDVYSQDGKRNRINTTIPLPLGLATHCTLADSFRRLKRRGRRWEIRHARRVNVEYVEYLEYRCR